MTDFNFHIESLERRVLDTESGKQDAVSVVHWRMLAKDGEFNANVYGAVPLGAVNPESFVAWSDLTPDHCKGWALAQLAMNKTAEANDPDAEVVTPEQMESWLQGVLQTQIDEKKNPSVLPGLPPAWNADR